MSELSDSSREPLLDLDDGVALCVMVPFYGKQNTMSDLIP